MVRSYQNGFTLLEAMVAITVITSVSFAVFSWVNQSARMLMRTDTVMMQELLVADLLSELEFTDLQREPEGVLSGNSVRLEWQAEVVSERKGRTKAGGVGFYDHSLNEITVSVFRENIQVDDYRIFVVSSVLARQPSQELRL